MNAVIILKTSSPVSEIELRSLEHLDNKSMLHQKEQEYIREKQMTEF